MRQGSVVSRSISFAFTLILAALFWGLHPLPSCSAKGGELIDFLSEIQQASDQVQSFSSDFIQEKKLALFAEPVIFHGSLTVVRPDRLRWEFSSPVPSVLIFTGDHGIRCNDQAPPAQFDLKSDPVMRTVAEQLWLWLGGDYIKLNELYRMEKKGESSLEIVPLDESISEYIGAVTITFNDISRQPEIVEILEPGGDSTRILFTSYLINKDIPEIVFSRCGTDE